MATVPKGTSIKYFNVITLQEMFNFITFISSVQCIKPQTKAILPSIQARRQIYQCVRDLQRETAYSLTYSAEVKNVVGFTPAISTGVPRFSFRCQ